MPKDAIPAIPPIPRDVGPQLRPVLQAIRDACMLRFGQTGNAWDYSPTLRELVDRGAVVPTGYDSNGQPAGNLGSGTPGPGVDTGGGGGSDDVFDSTVVPPAPTGLAVATAPYTNIVTWNEATPDVEKYVSFAEVWANSVDDINTASLVGVGQFAFTHPVEPMSTTYYWVRYVTYANIYGPYNAVSGTLAVSPQDPGGTLALLSRSLSESELTATLDARLSAATRGAFIDDISSYTSADAFEDIWDESGDPGALALGDFSVVTGDNPIGSKFVRNINVGGSNERSWLVLNRELAIPVADSNVYKISGWARRVSGANTFYLGVMGLKGDVRSGGGELVNMTGQNSYWGVNGQHSFAAHNYSGFANTDWRYFEAYFRRGTGNGVYGPWTGIGYGSLENPSLLHSDCEYIVPFFILNNISTTGTLDLAYIALEPVYGGIEVEETLNKYAVKVDANGNVAGFGLIAEENNGAIVSQFQIAVDRFAVRSPGASDFSLVVEGNQVVMDGALIKSATIDTAQIKDLAVKTAKIGDLQVTRGKIQDLAVSNAKIDNGTIQSAKIGTLQVKTANIDNEAVNNSKIRNLAVSTLKIQDDAVTVPVGLYRVAVNNIGYSPTVGTTIATLTINSGGQPIMVGCFFFRFRDGNDADGYVGVRRNGSFVWGMTRFNLKDQDKKQQCYATYYDANPPSGTNTYTIQVSPASGDRWNCTEISAWAIGMKK